MNSAPIYDVIIIGGGPAGVSAAIWCADLGMSAVVLERCGKLFGQLHKIHNPIENYLGISARSGAEFIEHFQRSVSRWKPNVESGVTIVSVDCRTKIVKLEGGQVLAGKALIIATGVRRRTLGVPGEKEFLGRGVLESGARERESVTGKRVVVVGGGDAAVENALILAEYASEVTVIHRRNELTARDLFVERVNAEPKIRLIRGSEVIALGGDQNLRFVDVIDKNTGEPTRVETDFFIARIGYAANSELVSDQVETDPKGYLLIDSECRTNLEGIYAIGDVASPVSPTIATAAGMGATAAKSVFTLLSR